MAAPKGNKFWEARAKHGRDKIFSTPEILWESAVEYFEWVEDNPLMEAKLVTANGQPVLEELPKMRAMTIEGLSLFMGVDTTTWYDYAKQEDFSPIARRITNVIRDQKFTGASAGFLNANIIARDLGLKEATSNEHSGPNGGPIGINASVVVAEMTNDEAAHVYKELMG